jgi:hypothetical protein
MRDDTQTILGSPPLIMSRVHRARGLDDSAEAELLAGIRLLEEQQTRRQGHALQTSLFDQGASLFDEMASFQLDIRRDTETALSFSSVPVPGGSWTRFKVGSRNRRASPWRVSLSRRSSRPNSSDGFIALVSYPS